MKFVLLIIIVFICAYIGYGLSNYYNKRVNFFKDLKLLFEKIKLEINFSHLKLISILNSFSTTSKEVDYLKKNFKKCLQENLNFNEENLFYNIKILSNDEKQLLILFLTSLNILISFVNCNIFFREMSTPKHSFLLTFITTNDVKQNRKRECGNVIVVGHPNINVSSLNSWNL